MKYLLVFLVVVIIFMVFPFGSIFLRDILQDHQNKWHLRLFYILFLPVGLLLIWGAVLLIGAIL